MGQIKVSVLLLFLEQELEVTWLTISHLFPQLGNGVTLSVLYNGQGLKEAGQKISALEHVHYYEAGTNLGVAGGRNFLLRTPECRSADVVMLIDNDVILPTDYVERSKAFLLNQENSGVIGASVIDYRLFESELSTMPRKTGDLGQTYYHLTCAEIGKALEKDPTKQWFSHLGAHPDWTAVYLGSEYLIDQIGIAAGISSEFPFYELRRNDPYITNQVITGGLTSFSVSNVPGCCQSFRRSLVDEIGDLCDAFNPYGFEDVDFCIRAIRRGYTNYVDARTFLLHGTDTRHIDRVDARNLLKKERNKIRCLTILAHRHAPDRFEELIRKRILNEVFVKKCKRMGFKEMLYTQLVGFDIAKRQIEEGKAPPIDEVSHA